MGWTPGKKVERAEEKAGYCIAFEWETEEKYKMCYGKHIF